MQDQWRSRAFLGLALLVLLPACGADEPPAPEMLDDLAFEVADEPIVANRARPAAWRRRVVSVFGTVLDAHGQARAGCDVELLPFRTVDGKKVPEEQVRVLGRARSGDDGRWRLQAEATGHVALRVSDGGTQAVALRPLPWHGGRVDLRSVETTALALRAVLPDGRPAAAPRAIRFTSAPGAGPMAVAYAELTLHFFQIPPGTCDLLVRAPGRATAVLRGVPVGQGVSARPVAILPPGRILRVVVTDGEGKPLRDAAVEIREPRLDGYGVRAGRTDDEGLVATTVAAEAGNEVHVRAARPGRGPALVRARVPAGVAAEAADGAWILRVALERSRLVQGRLVDAAGKAVPRATVEWLDGFPRRHEAPDEALPARVVETDDLGRFAIPWLETGGRGGNTLFAAKDGAGFVAARVAEHPGEARVRLVLCPVQALTGRIRDRGEKPLEGALVTWIRADDGREPHERDAPWHDLRAAIDAHAPGLLAAVTNARGEFAGALPPGTWRLHVRHGEQELVDAAEVEASAAGPARHVEVAFPRGSRALDLQVEPAGTRSIVDELPARLAAQLRRARGREAPVPLQGTVVLQPARGSDLDAWTMRVPLPGDGRVHLPGLLDVPYHVQVLSPGHAPAVLRSSNPGRGVVDVPLVPDGGVNARIHRDAQADVARLVLRDAPEAHGHDRGRPITIGGRPFVETEDGRLLDALTLASRRQRVALLGLPFTLRPVAPGDYDLGLFLLDGRSAAHAQKTQVPARVLRRVPVTDVAPTAMVDGRVTRRMDAGFVPVAGARCELRPYDRRAMLLRGLARTRTDADGRFAFLELTQGTYALRVEAASGHAWEGRVDVDSPDPPALQVGLEEPGALLVRVEDPEGRPVPGARIQLLTALGRQVGPLPMGRADETGAFRQEGLPRGDYVVIVRAPGWAGPNPWPTATVTTAPVNEVRVTMTPAKAR